MKNSNIEEISSKVWSKLEEYKKDSRYNMLTDSQLLSNMVISGTITLEELDIALDARKNKNKSR